ncbi:tetrapyrrole biosynthesis, uroporphyrinogen III synthase [Lasiosphaeria hispida]|uniref:Tetrapyrrole biosynthesis, uroporphyrinogen III synthase n=1 Tax=Lasiosphaeria hispida TaxID=260671 RepID=A0AAJ0MAK9_9PEZI|nr:tetrapyrrole biosynthesis, uroporphyrinogen III synthase [Lasiosphaeria hispida]
MPPKTPIFLLKTRSTPGDAYEELFSTSADDGFDFEPIFVPVLEHRFDEVGMATVRNLLRDQLIGRAWDSHYGGLVFTSQRAVEAFTALVREGRDRDGWLDLLDIPVYSVGPATTRALRAVPQDTPLQIFGEHTGNGADLARFIVEHYTKWYKDRPSRPPLLFLVGEQRRDIIPRVLAASSIPIDEVVVYGTGVVQSFKGDFEQLLQGTADRPLRWVVVFSPTGCDSMLSALDLLDENTDRAKPMLPGRRTYIATIGPTTRDYLVKKFAYTPNVCSEQPTPEGVRKGIARYSTPVQ